MQESIIKNAAARFGIEEPVTESLGDGLIHHTYKISSPRTEDAIVLQCINQNTFPQPQNIIHNYVILNNYLQQHPGKIRIPALLKTKQEKFYWVDDSGNFWRATEFIPHSYSISIVQNEQQAFIAAHCFAQFTSNLENINTDALDTIIQGFHDLSLRYNQFEESIGRADIRRLMKSTHLIAEFRQRKYLVDFYEWIKSHDSFKIRVMHHDCKISNILFNDSTHDVICPVDLDTTMPGYYFSDVGDMIRTMACSVDENSTDWEDISIRVPFYDSIIKGYLEGMESSLTTEEKNHIHHSGLMLMYMQALRFLTDFLNNDTYYKTTYPEQNLNRALNQFILLERLEEFLTNQYNYSFIPG